MQMFQTFLNSIPKDRSEMVEELELPDVTVSPYIWEPDDSLASRSDSLTSAGTDECDAATYSTDSSIPLSRAMTDSDIDYERFRRYKNRSVCDPWDQMKIALDAFSPEYLESLNRFQNSAGTEPLPTTYERRKYDEELAQKMRSFFEECQVFTPDDPGLEELEEALATLDMAKIDSEPLHRKTT